MCASTKTLRGSNGLSFWETVAGEKVMLRPMSRTIKKETWGQMFAVVGLTLNDISSGDLPQLRLAGALDARLKQIHYPPGTPTEVAVYTTSSTDTQALVARAKYREQGEFLVFLYFNDAAVQICKDAGIPLHIVDRVEDKELPANRETVLERSYLAPVSV
jgi:hypothetical protein